jgi:hypothetical protein
MDPDPAIFVTELQDANKNLFKKRKFFCLILFAGTFTSFFKDPEPDPYLLTNGSESGRPRNMWILWIQIGIRIRSGTLVVTIQNLKMLRSPR